MILEKSFEKLEKSLKTVRMNIEREPTVPFTSGSAANRMNSSDELQWLSLVMIFSANLEKISVSSRFSWRHACRTVLLCRVSWADCFSLLHSILLKGGRAARGRPLLWKKGGGEKRKTMFRKCQPKFAGFLQIFWTFSAKFHHSRIRGFLRN